MPVKTGLHRNALHLKPDGATGRFRADLPTGASGSWCCFTVQLRSAERWWAKLEAADDDRSQVVREAFLGRSPAAGGGPRRGVVMHLPTASHRLFVQIYTASGEPTGAPLATLAVLSRPMAALAVLIRGWRSLPAALAGSLMGLSGRVRATLGHAPALEDDVPPYTVWTSLYDSWGQIERDALARCPSKPSIAVAVVGDDIVGRALTVADLDVQWKQPVRIVSVDRPADFQTADETWVLVLGAGERVPPHALACFAHAALRWPEAHVFYADADMMSDGIRAKPLFKPQPDPWLLGSGLITSGGCLLRRSAMARETTASDASAWRLSAALSAGAGALRPIPFILTHLSGPAPVFRNAKCRYRPTALPLVSIVIPSAAQSVHVLRCARKLSAMTTYPHLEILVAVSKVDPTNAIQTRIITALGRLPHLRVVDLGLTSFNYAAANNAAVCLAKGDLLLLLNDDVVPVQPDWLQVMVSIVGDLAGVQADVVGARLLYGNDTVQHGGVILGLANLCEHAFRLAPRDDPGPYGLAMLDRQVSAVTGACMLLRRSLYETLGGLDESFAVALNDVDLCLRACATGARIVLAAGIELYHYESLSLGRHYENGRAALEAIEVNRLRQRWAGVIANDPFYNPNASLMPGQEFQPSFPPRCSPLSWINAEMP